MIAPRRQRPSRRRLAVILVLTLWVVLVLTLLAHSLAFEMQIEASLTTIYRDQFQAEQFARIGIARAVCDLRNDRLYETEEEEGDLPKQFDALGDSWAGGTIKPRHFDVPGAGRREIAGQYDLLIIDEESKLGLNSMRPNSIDAFRDLLIIPDVDEAGACRVSDQMNWVI